MNFSKDTGNKKGKGFFGKWCCKDREIFLPGKFF